MKVDSRNAQRLRRDRLQPHGVFYNNEIGNLSRPSRGWVRGRCPFHESRSGTSFSVNLETGGFYCFGCGKSGGDPVAFVMLRDGIDFVSAAKKLGAWDDAAKPTRLQKVVVGRDLVCDFVVDGVQHSVRVRDDPRNWLELLRRIYAEASDRLTEIGRGDVERFDGEQENCWSIMADALPQIREAEGV